MQEILKLLDNSKIIDTYEILSFEQVGSNYFFKSRIQLIDKTILFVLESFRNDVLIYSYHWQNYENKLLVRWDNAPHHKKIETFPYHMHDPELRASTMVSLKDVLNYIEKVIANRL